MDALTEECRLDGIECSHLKVPIECTPIYRAYCEEKGLFSVAGTDCHSNEDIEELLTCHGGKEAWLDEFLERLDGKLGGRRRGRVADATVDGEQWSVDWKRSWKSEV